ncbi:MAG: FBP domain-containing protein [Pseudomonadales bacterium]|nr:FBP domain-containing protein [Pseudomonadales bacterium]MEE2892626.1 FBP domain-containing protein [Pseudomonadota bacterium]
MQPFDKHELAELFADVPTRERHLVNVEYVDWGVLDFLGWTHPSGHLGYVATRIGDEAVGLVLRRTLFSGRSRRMQMCAWCHTLNRSTELAMFSRWVDGSDGRRSIGLNLCKHLDCSLRLRNLTGDPRQLMPETIHLSYKIQRLRDAVNGYVRRVRPVA